MTTPNYTMTPDFTAVLRLMEFQTRFAVEASQGMMKLAMLPWSGLSTGFGSICAPMGSVTVKAGLAGAPVSEASVSEALVPVAEAPIVEAAVAEAAVAEAPIVETAVVETAVVETAVEETVVIEAVADAPVEEDRVPEAPVKAVAETVAEVTPEPVETVAEVAAPAVAPAVEDDADVAIKPEVLAAPNGDADDLTALNGVGPKLAEALKAEGIYHFSQIAAWTEANVAWVDDNLAGVRGRASRNGWVAQAAELTK